MAAQAVQREPHPTAERVFWNELTVHEATQQIASDGDGRRADVVTIQRESLVFHTPLQSTAMLGREGCALRK